MVTFFSEETLITEYQLLDFERVLGLTLPPEYRNHLLQHNGGQCRPNVFSFVENGNETTSRVDWFLALYDGDYDNLKNYAEIYKMDEKRMPDSLLPIAHDDGGNMVCIACHGVDFGKIYFWDHENEVDYSNSDDADYSNLYLIAPSFSDFLAALH